MFLYNLSQRGCSTSQVHQTWYTGKKAFAQAELCYSMIIKYSGFRSYYKKICNCSRGYSTVVIHENKTSRDKSHELVKCSNVLCQTAILESFFLSGIYLKYFQLIWQTNSSMPHCKSLECQQDYSILLYLNLLSFIDMGYLAKYQSITHNQNMTKLTPVMLIILLLKSNTTLYCRPCITHKPADIMGDIQQRM